MNKKVYGSDRTYFNSIKLAKGRFSRLVAAKHESNYVPTYSPRYEPAKAGEIGTTVLSAPKGASGQRRIGVLGLRK